MPLMDDTGCLALSFQKRYMAPLVWRGAFKSIIATDTDSGISIDQIKTGAVVG